MGYISELLSMITMRETAQFIEECIKNILGKGETSHMFTIILC